MNILNTKQTAGLEPIARMEDVFGCRFPAEVRAGIVETLRDSAVESIRDWARETMDGRPGGPVRQEMEERIAEHLAAMRENRRLLAVERSQAKRAAEGRAE